MLGLAGSSVPSINSVREEEFRSRWADYQVDRRLPQQATDPSASSATEDQGGFLSLFSRSFSDHLRNGPFQLRADLSAGYEFTNEQNLRIIHPNGAESSPFISPALGVSYNRELGAVTLSARYSVGYVYYLDQSYLAVNHNGGILSQTAGLDLGVEGSRTTLASNTSASYGNGQDIESGEQRGQLTITEGFTGVYTLTEYTQLGVTGTLGYSDYTGGTVADTDATNVSGTVYGDYVFTGKTRLRLELGAGDVRQTADTSNRSDRSYYQALFHVNYIASPKLSFDAGLGYGLQNDSSVQGRKEDGSHVIYTFTVNYVPTEKTSVSFHVGYEGVDVDPDLSLQVHWQPRLNTTVGLSVYQNSNFSTFLEAQSLVTRGVLVSVQQTFFGKVTVGLSGGAEQSKGYSSLGSQQGSDYQDPYYFGAVTLLWQFNSSLALQAYYRGYTGQAGLATNHDGLQSRASASLRLTF